MSGMLRRRAVVGLLLAALLCAAVKADTLSGTVKDPSGAVVAGAKVEINGGNLTQALQLSTDTNGKFVAPNLAPGKYTVRVSKAGFDEVTSTVELQGTAEIIFALIITTQQTSVTVSDKSMAFANSDPLYRQLRDVGLGDTFRCENFTLPLDVGMFEFKTGTLTLLRPIDGKQTGVVFVGRGHFSLKPLGGLDTSEMVRRTSNPSAEEDFSEVVFRFTPEQFPLFSPSMKTKVDTPTEAASAFQHWKEKVRHRHEFPEGLTQAFFETESVDNVDADVLAAIYNRQHPSFLNCYIHGAAHKDLRFYLRAHVGALPQIDSPEEVALVNFGGGNMDDGIWYSQHLKTELLASTASSSEDRRLFATRRYKIETVVGKNDHLTSRASIYFEPLIEGERVMKFALLPNLRVNRVTGEKGQDLHFIQENRKEDGSFYVVLDEPAAIGKTQLITVDYGGDKVLSNAGSGSYYIGARESWYPNLNGFGEKALYDLTFKVPHSNVLISVGKQDDEHNEAGFSVTHWTTPVPIAVAGFNYGRYQKITMPDSITHYDISGYYLPELPDSLKPYENGALGGMSPGAMTKYALEQARAQMQVCTLFFGRAPSDNLYITEQPNFNFGQSWPNLVYLPISAYIDSTQRWLLFGQINSRFTGFVQEVTPHEVAHQWFGHAVGWSSYHDQWLSEGFAEFAAGLFLQQAMGPKWQKDYVDFWQRQHDRLLEKNNYGISPNDAGPLWLGTRLISPKSERAYQGVTYAKGAFVLSMLRSMMRADSGPDPDQAFIEMMHDFITSQRDRSASSESFKSVAEKHITKRMDLQKNGRLDWFFREWVMGTEVPRYTFKYEMQPVEGGTFKIHTEITQSDVDPNFAMLLPVFADFGGGMVRLLQVEMVGNSSRTITINVDKKPKKVALNALRDILER
jgi:Peptidase family M1 domain/Carboxypeptidase regulatory-like domain